MPVVDLLDDIIDLTPGRQVRAGAAEIEPEALVGQLEQLQGQLAQQIQTLADAAGARSWPAAGAELRKWRTATVADLSRGGALTVMRAAAPSSRDSRGGAGGAAAAGGHRPVLTAHDVASGGPRPGTRTKLTPSREAMSRKVTSWSARTPATTRPRR
ncbi:hypothetical protein ACFQZC_08975 [Streptacidiphilus monticola]